VIHMTHSKIMFEMRPERQQDKRENGSSTYEKGHHILELKGLKQRKDHVIVQRFRQSRSNPEIKNFQSQLVQECNTQ